MSGHSLPRHAPAEASVPRFICAAGTPTQPLARSQLAVRPSQQKTVSAMLAAVETGSHLPATGLSYARVRPLRLSASLSVGLAIATYATIAAVAAVIDFVGYRTARFDLGNAGQAIWNTAHGHVLETTSVGGEQFTRLGSHVEPLLLLLAPLWLIWSSPVVLVVVQAAAVSAGALPVFWLARKHLGSERAAAFFALAYLLYPATQWNALDPNLGFHAISLSLPLLLYAVWWLDEERWSLFAVTAFLAAASNEQVPVIVGCLGLWYGLSRRRPFLGVSMVAAGLAVTAFDFLYVVPHFSPTGSALFADRYTAVGGTPAEIIKTVAFHPLKAAEVVLTGHKLTYIALLFVPLLGLCFRAPLLLLALSPPLALNLLSSAPDQTSIRSHYAASTAAVLFAAAVFGAARLKADPWLVSRAVLTAVSVTAVITPLWTAVPVARKTIAGAPLLRAERQAVALIPTEASVSASNILGAHLSARRRILLFPVIRDADWIAVDTADMEGARPFRPVVERLRRRGSFGTVYDSNGVVVMRRVQQEPSRDKEKADAR
jgi:uncharacterized membrane protein